MIPRHVRRVLVEYTDGSKVQYDFPADKPAHHRITHTGMQSPNGTLNPRPNTEEIHDIFWTQSMEVTPVTPITSSEKAILNKGRVEL